MTEGHPDKVCDAIADAVLDAYPERDKRTRVACEVLAKSGTVVLAGEVHSAERIVDTAADAQQDQGAGDQSIMFGYAG